MGRRRRAARPAPQAELRALAERLDAPVCTTYMGRGALPDSHPLAVGAGCDETAFQELLRDADVVLAVGTELGAETTGQWSLELHGELIHLDVRAEHIGRTYATAVGLAGDARPTLAALAAGRARRRERDGAARAAAVRERIAQGLAAMGMDTERELLATIRAAIPPEGVTAFDMTILGYWAAPHLPVERGGSFLYPLGSGTLGYAWPAAIGAKVGHPDVPVVAVHGDGGFLYATQELATARQHGIAAKLVLVDDQRLRDPQGLPVGGLRGHARGRPRAARLRGAGRRLRRARCSPARPTASRRRSTAPWPSTARP